jgi:hypothetical protein
MERMEKQTAVSWLVSQLNKQGFAQVVTDEEFKQANEMFEQQIMDAYETSYISMMTSEQYYNETFKSE